MNAALLTALPRPSMAVTCMIANYAGALYLVAIIAANPGTMLGVVGTPPWMRAIVTFRSAVAFILAFASLIQIGLVLTGRYGAHRWLGRILVRLTTASTALTLLLPTSSLAAVAVVAALLCVELTLFFGECSAH